ncbi:MAG: hypothetical protein AAGL10_08465 [Pseudomonadota bacterium]
MPDTTHAGVAAFIASFFAALVLAWILGGKPEKAGVYTLAAMFAAQAVLYSTVGNPQFDQIDVIAVTSDVIGLLVFTLIALNADRVWPFLAAAMQLISGMAHLTHGFRVMLGQSYVDFNAYPTAIVLFLLIAGTLLHRYRLHRHGKDRDWVPFQRYAEFRRLAQDAEQF